MRNEKKHRENDQPDEFPEGHLIDESGENEHRRRRTKIKIRKRVRIKKKSSPAKKLKRTLELIAWIILLAAFIATIIVLVVQLDFNSKNRKKRSFNSNQNPVQLTLLTSTDPHEPNDKSFV